jgi:hypothetical protein
LPALLSQGLLKASSVLSPLRKGYYGLMSVLLVLAFMFLSRIKCPEQLKSCKVGELGKIIGLDRVPEAKCLRQKIAQIVDQKKADELSRALLHEWMEKDEGIFFYIDGHVRVYHGSQANLPKRFVSREKLCLSGTTEFWVNNELGVPYMVVIGELNDRLKDVMLNEIVPVLVEETASSVSREALEQESDRTRFVMVFDREAYDLGFFKELWENYRIAVLTYRKSVKDTWPVTDFAKVSTTVIGKVVDMDIAEKSWEHAKCSMREIRKLSDNGHQTSIITTVHQSSAALLVGKMFSRWSQENFFRYMVQDYDIDRLVEYGVEEASPQADVVNPLYKTLTYRIKKQREKLARVKAKLFAKIEQNLISNIDAVGLELQQQTKIQDAINGYEQTIAELKAQLKETPKRILIKDMPADIRYNKLKSESKLFMNVIRMIAYRAECAVANMLSPHYARAGEEIRMLVKEIIKSEADLIPDEPNKTLTIRLHCLSTPRANAAAQSLCGILNETETTFPGTDLRLVYQTV